jgi:hypothetical protein
MQWKIYRDWGPSDVPEGLNTLASLPRPLIPALQAAPETPETKENPPGWLKGASEAALTQVHEFAMFSITSIGAKSEATGDPDHTILTILSK